MDAQADENREETPVMEYMNDWLQYLDNSHGRGDSSMSCPPVVRSRTCTSPLYSANPIQYVKHVLGTEQYQFKKKFNPN